MRGGDIGYRDSAARCALCGYETRPAELEVKAGLALCPGCRAGELERVCHRWHFKLETRITGGATHFDMTQHVELHRPTRVEIVARVRQARESVVDVFWRMIRRMGDRGLDPERATFEKVRVEPHEGWAESTDRLQEQPGVREALLDLICMGCIVDLMPSSLAAMARARPQDFPDEKQVGLRLAVIGAAIERMAGRGVEPERGRGGA